jgi:hypothetical protein
MNLISKRWAEKYENLIRQIDHEKSFGIVKREWVEELLAVGMSCHQISDYLKVNLKPIKKICAHWKQTKLPEILKARAEQEKSSSLCQ